MNSQRKGDLTEATVIAELKRRAIPVSIPFGDNERYDIVLEAPGGRLLRGQVKTGWTRDAAVQFKGYSQHTNSEGNTYKPYTDGIDCFLVYSHEFERLFLVWVDEIGANMRIRVTEPDHRHHTTNWADDYAFDQRWPPTGERLRSMLGGRNPAAEPVSMVLRDNEIPFVRVEGEPYHFVACDGDGVQYTLRACSGTVVDGRMRFNTVSGDLDAYCIHCSETETTYLVPDAEFEKSISLRVEEPEQPDASIHWAVDYEFDERWPPRPAVG